MPHTNWTTFPLFPLASDGSCGCGKHGCKDAGKHPAVKWGAKSLRAGVQLAIPEGFGVGLATGERSGVVVVDLDRKNGVDGIAELEDLGNVPTTLAALTPSGGAHLYFRHPGKPVPNSTSKIGPGIDVRGDGGYVVLPPSQHRNGGLYRWIDEAADIAPLPDWLLPLLQGGKPPARPVTRASLERLAKRWKRSRSIPRQELGDALWSVCQGEVFARVGERDTTLYELSRDIALEFPHGDPTKISEHFASSVDLMERTLGDCPSMEVVLEKFERAYAELGTATEDTWRARLKTSETGTPKGTQSNVSIVLEAHPLLSGVLAYDERRCRIVLRSAPPWPGDDCPRDSTDADITRCVAWLGEIENIQTSDSPTAAAMLAQAQRASYDPVQEYLDALRWDGQKRIDTWLSRYARTDDTIYTRIVGAKFLVGAVARAMCPGAKVDTMLILEGEQGLRKSTILRTLAGDAYFADDIPDLESKDARDYLRGPWIVELKELHAFSRKASSMIKGFLDQRTDRYRPAYGRTTLDHPRRCVFAGTTNEEEYLHDTSGNRRYWPVRVTEICDTDALARDKDQIWAEAMVRYQAGVEAHRQGVESTVGWWWLTCDEDDIAQQEQAQRETRDAWTDTIERALTEGVRRLGGDADPWAIRPGANGVTTYEILEHVLGIDASRRGHRDTIRAGTVLHSLGYVPRYDRAARRRRYYRPE